MSALCAERLETIETTDNYDKAMRWWQSSVYAGCGLDKPERESYTSRDPKPSKPSKPAAPDWFKRGYPKVVSKSSLPSVMRPYLNGSKVLAVAPGVWTTYIRGYDLVELAMGGTPIGYCAPIKIWQETANAHGASSFSMSCWN